MGLGQGFDRSEARLLGVYDHFYADSVFGGEADGNPDTHYVVLAYQLILAAPSGDGDFVRVAELAQGRGCRVEVLAFRNMTTEDLPSRDLVLEFDVDEGEAPGRLKAVNVVVG